MQRAIGLRLKIAEQVYWNSFFSKALNYLAKNLFYCKKEQTFAKDFNLFTTGKLKTDHRVSDIN